MRPLKKTVSFSKNSTNVFFHILTRCNLSCRHCYINPQQHGSNTLPVRTIEAWLRIFADGTKAANVIFIGGEPTLHPELPSAIKKARRIGFNSITIDTNGYLFNDILSKVGQDDVDYFNFSLDGATKNLNDAIRGPGSYDRCVEGIRKTVAMGFATSLIYTVSNDNIHELPDMVPIIRDLGIDRFFIQVIGIRGKSAGDQPKKLQVLQTDWIRIIPGVAEKVAELGITTTYPKVFLDHDEPFECAGRVAENYFIFPNGRVYRCPLCEDFPLHSLVMEKNRLIKAGGINESHLFELSIPEGCVMNKIIQPENLSYDSSGIPKYKIACCMLKEEISGKRG
jgi:MoaA/NifB/PqqE/SkfB family radical SAM enzyme